MKKIYIIVFVVVLIVIGVLIFMLTRKNNKPSNTKDVEIGDIVYLHFSYSKGYMANAHIIYSIDYDSETGEHSVSIKPHGIPDEEKVTVKEPVGFREKVKEVLIKYHVENWNGFREYAKDVLDGDDFSFNVKMENNQRIDADGYMAWPENYRSVRDELDKLFMEIYNKEKGIKTDE